MMHNNKLIVAIKTNGKVLREDKETVFLPFGSEYSIFLKNLNTVRALLSITIDGTDVLDGEKLVVHANSEVDLQRFIKQGNKDQGNRFKFIERTSKIENHRGVGAVDGLVQVTFQYEKRKALPVPEKIIEHHHHYDYWGPRYFARYPLLGDSLVYGHAESSVAQASDSGLYKGLISQSMTATASSAKATTDNALLRNVKSAKCSTLSDIQSTAQFSDSHDTMYFSQNAASVNDVGITVAGSVSDQKFHTVDDFEVETEKYTIVLNLKGQTAKTKVQKPVTVKTKLKCDTCGTVNKSNAKFCRECGTALEKA